MLKPFKLAVLATAIGLSVPAVAQVPVVDGGANEQLGSVNEQLAALSEKMDVLNEFAKLQLQVQKEAGQANLDLQKANAKATGNMNQALSNQMVGTAKGEAQAEQMRKNAEVYDKKMGAKPASACGVLSAGISVSRGDLTKVQVKDKLIEVGDTHVSRGRKVGSSEGLIVDRGLRTLQLYALEQAIEEDIGSVPLTTDGYPTEGTEEDVWLLQQQKMVNMAVPNPVFIPENINDENITMGEAVKNSSKLIQLQRQAMVNEVLSGYVSERTKVYDADWIQQLSYDSSQGALGVPQDVIDNLDSGVSEVEALSVLSNYRLKNPEWLTTTMAGSNQIGLMRDANVMQAQSLQLLNNIDKRLQTNNLLLAYIYAHRIEQSGVPKTDNLH